jgi:hypothetical protein
MSMLLNVAITTAVSLQVGTVYQIRGGPGSAMVPTSLAVQGTAAGTAGTSMQWWLQTSFDGGGSWCDAMSFTHSAAGRACGIVLSNPTAGVAAAAPTDGTMLTGVVQNGIFAGLWRVKYTSIGTWTLGNLRIDSFGPEIEPSS